jgi:hypothetical protein
MPLDNTLPRISLSSQKLLAAFYLCWRAIRRAFVKCFGWRDVVGSVERRKQWWYLTPGFRPDGLAAKKRGRELQM